MVTCWEIRQCGRSSLPVDDHADAAVAQRGALADLGLTGDVRAVQVVDDLAQHARATPGRRAGAACAPSGTTSSRRSPSPSPRRHPNLDRPRSRESLRRKPPQAMFPTTESARAPRGTAGSRQRPDARRVEHCHIPDSEQHPRHRQRQHPPDEALGQPASTRAPCPARSTKTPTAAARPPATPCPAPRQGMTSRTRSVRSGVDSAAGTRTSSVALPTTSAIAQETMPPIIPKCFTPNHTSGTVTTALTRYDEEDGARVAPGRAARRPSAGWPAPRPAR